MASHRTIFTAFRSSTHRSDFMASPEEGQLHIHACLSICSCLFLLFMCFFSLVSDERGEIMNVSVLNTEYPSVAH
jgi:hypothetical protein